MESSESCIQTSQRQITAICRGSQTLGDGKGKGVFPIPNAPLPLQMATELALASPEKALMCSVKFTT